MNYRKAAVYPSRSSGGRIEPIILVMHTTEGYGRAYLDQLFSGQTKRDGKQKISVHWCIYRTGDVVEYAPWRPGEAVRCIHAGESSWRGRRSCNGFSLGYEIEHMQGDPYPEAVVEAIIALNRLVKAEYPSIELVTHAQIAPGRKIDPTAPWDSIRARIYAAWNEEGDDMTDDEHQTLTKIAEGNRKLSFTVAIANALAIGDAEKAAALNSQFYELWPGGESGLPKGWPEP